ncbi:MAG: ABC transporter substrate-binding protein [Deltaproteobacteria bacterium]|nr:ABC transporter substrate-binding protein [Deltaproteobacteria bacterium]
MRITVLKKMVGSFTLSLFLMSAPTHAVAASATVLQAKQEAEAKGYIFFTAHDEIVAMAKKEGRLKLTSRLGNPTRNALINGFRQKYPFITDVHVEEISGTEAFERFLLEIQAGRAKGWDIAHIPIDFAKEYIPYLMKNDILGMAKHGVLKIDSRMIHPVERNMVDVTSSARVVAYNRKLISEDKVPARWEDFLKPEFKGRKFILDIRPLAVTTLVPAWGLERTLDFAQKLAAQQPVWMAASSAKHNTLVATGEYALFLSPNLDNIKSVMAKDRTGNLSYKVVEPVPTRIADHPSGILTTADHPHAGLLWHEFLASPEGQEILDKHELRASVYTPGSVIEQATRGKKLSVVDWDHFTKFQEYVAKVVKAHGYPKADN